VDNRNIGDNMNNGENRNNGEHRSNGEVGIMRTIGIMWTISERKRLKCYATQIIPNLCLKHLSFFPSPSRPSSSKSSHSFHIRNLPFYPVTM
jgi:hypothetical protein